MSTLDPRIETIRQRYELAREDFWQLPQNKGTWLVKHSALEVVAVKAGIEFDNPQIIEARTADKIAVLSVRGMMERRTEWATGEASPANNKNAYPWAMAEKRAKDRVILKLIGIHGLVYSEDEMSDVEQPKAKSREPYRELQEEIDACLSLEDLATLWRSKPFQMEFVKLPADWQDLLAARKDERKADLAPKPAVKPDFDHLERA